ncbi:maleylpyruvate isomerase family mycothiol-dependent enzyme [Nakamurella multipartita]|uniref:Mycothiol-dependent maleylpyruvate isomerase metal-binding domain-containing protein n=1 Tax=Nakamurella multipartita (strain ATCC 700099 / DSM 44233 / CIP 104796 / JCM 9543 / NBRC 105858 / Y-104) TaxID=479431 RepID=C8X738_NAKMY|nr:maleylpyruvate isomerase family mycothiol-dependent enzyme [Nakamurella multipartita]ACV76907.1 hypothetical protein Namu_0488 [Nakamurella multipartita DSM 44233]
MPESDSRRTFAAAAQAFAELVDRIPDDAWTGPGLGDWDLRALVGHASRSLVTVLTYLPRIAETEAVPTTAAYYAAAAQIMAAVTERGRQAGAALGNDPAATVRTLVRDCARALAATTDDPVIESIAGGMRLSGYLVTRTFELVVHSLDIAAATGLSYDPPADALAESLALAVDVAVDRGQGARLLLALTGRASLASGFSVV